MLTYIFDFLVVFFGIMKLITVNKYVFLTPGQSVESKLSRSQSEGEGHRIRDLQRTHTSEWLLYKFNNRYSATVYQIMNCAASYGRFVLLKLLSDAREREFFGNIIVLYLHYAILNITVLHYMSKT